MLSHQRLFLFSQGRGFPVQIAGEPDKPDIVQERPEPKRLLSEWDAFSLPILTELSGIVKYGDILDGVTMQEQLDEHTGLSRRVIIESKDADTRPRITIKDEHGKTKKIPNTNQEARYFLPVGANINVSDGDRVEAGDIIARIPRETVKTKDITGGLPRVAELFEARKPKEHSVISEIDGIVSFGRDTKGKRKVIITPEIGEPKEYLISKGKHLSVRDGDRVRAGEPLMDGSSNPHDILKVLGEKALAKYLVDEVQEVYRLQGVKINDKHIEVIVRQMLRRVQISAPGDSHYILGEQVERSELFDTNDRLRGEGKVPATYADVLLGITKASLSTDSFISAASFQETTRVLTEAAIMGKRDELRGLKENVIVGRLIPAGTGMAYHQARKVKEDMDESERRAIAMQEAEELAAVQMAAVDANAAAPAEPAGE